MLVVQTHPNQPKMSDNRKNILWEMFLINGGVYSAEATLLPYIINRCVEEKVPFHLTGDPSTSYFIEPLKRKGKNNAGL